MHKERRRVGVGLVLWILLLSPIAIICQQAMDKSLREVIDIEGRHEAELFKIPGVRGVGVGKDEGKFVLQVFITDKANPDLLPKEIEGVPIKITVSGEFYALGPPEEANQRKGILLVVNKGDNNLSLIDTSTNATLGTVPTGEGPHEVVLSPDGKYAFVSNYGVSGRPGNTISVVDIQQQKETGKIDLGDFKKPHGMAISKDGKRLYVTCEANRALVILDLISQKVIRSLKTDQDISHLVVLSPDETKAYTSNLGSDTVTVMDLQKNLPISNVPLEKVPEGIDVSPDGKTLFVANRSSDNFSVIDTATNKVIKLVPTGSFPYRLKVTQTGRFILVSNGRGADVSVFDGSDYKEIARVKTGGKLPSGLLVHPMGHKFYVANTGSNTVSVVEIGSWKILEEIKTGNEPDGLAFLSKVPTP